MKKILCAFIAAALLILGGCGSSSPVTYGRYVDTEAEAMGRQIILREDGNCSFRYSALYSLSFRGTYEVSDGTLTITNSEGKHFVFTVKDDTLIYKADSSDSLDLEETDEPLKDGTVFELRNAIKS